jgi:hypothetical protein
MSSKTFNEPGRARALLVKAKLEPHEAVLVSAEHTPSQAADALMQGGHHMAALKLLAWALPRREAVWWAAEFVAGHLDEKAAPEEKAALVAAHRWVVGQTEEDRRAAEAAAAAVDYGTPAGQAAIAACWSGGSLAPPKMAVVPPPEHLLPKAAANAVMLSVLQGEPKKAGEKFRAALALAGDVADGKSRWREGAPAGHSAKPAQTRR